MLSKPDEGDSGGPLVLHDTVKSGDMNHQIIWLVGVVSFGIGCAQPDIGGGYASVSFYSDWISNTINHFMLNKIPT